MSPAQWQDFNLIAVLSYFCCDVIPHKLAIIVCGLWLNFHWYITANPYRKKLHLSLWRLLVHDKSKFYPDEFIAYSNYYRGANRKSEETQRKFKIAFRLHCSRNTHHGEYYMHADYKMPLIDLVELLCDWFAACIGYEKRWPQPGKWRWIHSNWNKINTLHASNKVLLAAMLTELGYGKEVGDISSLEKAKGLLDNQEFEIFQYFYQHIES